jgi:glycerol-3-phosphate acyltransferase PlsY
MIDSTAAAVVVTAVAGYLLGSIPVAVLVGRSRGIDLRSVGDRNPGYWNAKEVLGPRAAIPVFAGDVAKGALAAGLGRLLGGPWWVGYVGAAAAMIGHAWPVFAGFRGGRSVSTFVGAMVVLAPLPGAIALVVCVVVTAVTHRFAVGARVAVFGFPLIQALFQPRAHVAATGALMCIIGLRFAMAAASDRRRSARVGPAPPGPAGPDGAPDDPTDGGGIGQR